MHPFSRPLDTACFQSQWKYLTLCIYDGKLREWFSAAYIHAAGI